MVLAAEAPDGVGDSSRFTVDRGVLVQPKTCTPSRVHCRRSVADPSTHTAIRDEGGLLYMGGLAEVRGTALRRPR